MFLIRRDISTPEEIEALALYLDGQETSARDTFGVLVPALRASLRPWEPDRDYAERVRAALIAEAKRRVGLPLPFEPWREPRFLIGAASLVSAAAVLAIVARSRIQSVRAA